MRRRHGGRQPVVFVIGAGASNEYRMPLGVDLKASIAAAAWIELITPQSPRRLGS
jgi:hypothetical protein